MSNPENNLKIQIIDWYSDDHIDEDSTSSSQDSDDSYKPQKDKSEYRIVIFGKDINEKTYTIEVKEFTPYFYIRLPDC